MAVCNPASNARLLCQVLCLVVVVHLLCAVAAPPPCTAELSPALEWHRATSQSFECQPSNEAEQSLSASWRKQATAPSWALARGVQTGGSTLRMRRFVSKLLRGDNVTVSVAGGSISRGWADSSHLQNGYKGCVAFSCTTCGLCSGW
jgi:hypothetical protein